MKANAYKSIHSVKKVLEALLIQCPPPPNITLKTFMTNLKIKVCGNLALGVFPQ